MRLEVRRLRLSVFDQHLCLAPLTEPGRLRPAYSFLSEPAGYQASYGRTDVIKMPNHWVRPLRRELRRNYFWRRYAAAPVDDEATAAWHRLLPFICRPHEFEASVAVEAPGPIRARLRAAVLLWPFGWSSILDCDIKADLTLDQLRDLSSAFRSPKPAAFRLGSQPATLADVFRALSRAVKQDLYTDPVPDDVLVVARHFIITLPGLSDGTLAFTYGQPSSDEMARFSDRDRARLHAALLGTQVDVSSLIARESAGGFMLTPLRCAGFVITYFDRGSLLYLGEAAFVGHPSKTLPPCLAANVRTCSLVTSALLHAIRAVKGMPGLPSSNLTRLEQDARSSLKQLWQSYSNPFCRKLFKHHQPLAAILGEGDREAEG